jgi:hypothetical protein
MFRYILSTVFAAALLAALDCISNSIADESPESPSFTLAASSDWQPYAHLLDIEPASVFDFSFINDAPAGKHGPLRVSADGHFEFADRLGQSVRFWGVNLCFSSNFLEPAEAERLAVRLVRSGYNTVRLHHYDRELVLPSPDHAALAPARLEQLDTLFAAMKRHGLYISIDLFSLRPFPPATLKALGIDPSLDISAQFKALVPLSDAAFEEWARFARALLTHRNPHTGLTWAEDPALIGICPVNEDSLLSWYARSPSIKQRYDDAFEEWASQPANQNYAKRNRTPAFNRFLHETQVRSDARLHVFLRSLGSQALLTGANFINGQELTLLRQHYDYVDNHQYWDHPKRVTGRWSLPFGFHQTGATAEAAGMPRQIMPTRIFQKPFVVTEFNYVRPNRYRGESAALMPAYASLQDWDAIYRFDYASNKDSALNGGVTGTFALADDPVGLLADRVGALVFRRGDIMPGRHAIAFKPDSDSMFARLNKTYPDTFSHLGLISRIGTLADDTKPPPGAALVTEVSGRPGTLRVLSGNPPLEAAAGPRYRSDTGQIDLRSDEGSLKVVTAHSELFVLPARHVLGGDLATVKNGSTPATIAVVSAGPLPLAQTRRLLVLHLTDALPDGMTFASEERLELRTRGQLPHLVQRGDATLSLRLAPGEWRAWAVDATGKRTREIPLARSGKATVLQAETITAGGTQLAYELIRDQAHTPAASRDADKNPVSGN